MHATGSSSSPLLKTTIFVFSIAASCGLNSSSGRPQSRNGAQSSATNKEMMARNMGSSWILLSSLYKACARQIVATKKDLRSYAGALCTIESRTSSSLYNGDSRALAMCQPVFRNSARCREFLQEVLMGTGYRAFRPKSINKGTVGDSVF